ncbi:MAG: ABC transporter ATP-binding protein [Gemmatimonadaceae bacterium]|nr:ABC transporter ATP-binding protein [Gemmatimonadaceae bacterium]
MSRRIDRWAMLRLARHVREPLRRERWTLLVGAVALLGEVALRALEPWPLKLIFDQLLPGTTAHTTRWVPALPVEQLALSAAVALLLVVALRAVSGYVQTVALALAANRVLASLRASLYRRLQLLPLSFHTAARTGDLTVRLTSDVGMLQDVALTAALPLAADAGMLVGMLGMMFWMQPSLTALALVPLPFFLLRWARTHRSIREVSRAQRQREGAIAATVAESFSAIKTVQALSLEEVLGKAFTRQNTKSASQGVQAKRLSAGLERSVDVLIAISTGVLLWQGTLRVMRGTMSAGELVVFVSYLKAAFKPLQSFAKYTGRLGKATAAAERVLEVMDHEIGIGDSPGAVAAPPFRGTIEFRNLSFAYPGGRTVLSDTSFRIEAGELVAIVGASGAGKSTIANLLLRLYEPTAGSVLVDGIDVRDVTVSSLRAQVGIVLQDTVLFAGTVRDNLTLGATRVDDALLDMALRVASADAFVRAMPDGLDSRVGERGVTLSNGQRQRIAIARAVLRATPMLVLDEPTVGLDDENERLVSEAILRLTKGRTTLLITHALHMAARADRVLVVGDGGIVEQGAPDVLLRSGGAFAAWYREHASRMPDSPVPLPVTHALAI